MARSIAIVVSRFNDFVTERLLAGAQAALTQAGTDRITVVRVPGAFEIPFAAQQAAATGRFDAIVCLGCLIRGETPHFEYISSACAHGITDAAAATGVPMSFGVLTTNSVEEALERAVDGPEAIRMDLHMLMLFGARERTDAEYRALLDSAGFALQRVVATGSPAGLSVLEATVAR